MVASRWQDHSEFGRITRGKADTIEAIRQINFDHVHCPPSGIGKKDMTEKAFKCPTKLHGLKRGQGEGVAVLIVETKVADDAGAPVVLRDNTKGVDAQVGQRTSNRKRKDGPIVFVDEVDHLLLQKGQKLVARLMGATVNGCLDAGGGPWGRGETDWGTMYGVVVKKSFGRMGDVAQIGKIGSRAKLMNITREARGGFEASNSIIN